MLTLKLHKTHKPLTAEKMNEMHKRGVSDGFLIPSLVKSQSVKMSRGVRNRGNHAPNTTSSETNNSTPQSSEESIIKRKVTDSSDNDSEQYTPPQHKICGGTVEDLFNSDYEEG